MSRDQRLSSYTALGELRTALTQGLAGPGPGPRDDGGALKSQMLICNSNSVNGNQNVTEATDCAI
ncbi:unnamed protein product [Acanthoscelides obtectus]|uniref:Uncharacterized protein n=1 Tax=Acanthoscelides obtectus TaxID=200917 RepID=A0A9P0KMQ2_ACAOB|nr:unnamed protein product [Acanthoscelides obtectus]CAH1977749.1 unnamed protein product [Acanthoscelides obtectus]CAK1685044.1 hypothetical protein AOBTE_LOCUS35207 [Acanthoscelides obtectus]CAK1685046.1 hypothetical protein AOBTE_LOCUS35208 [Acanthoscelides obtectus]